MATLVRAVRVLLILVLAVMVLELVTAILRPETGVVEKVVLVALVAGCVYAAAKVLAMSARLLRRVSP